MFSYVWPIALVVLSNTVYQICAKSVPERMNGLFKPSYEVGYNIDF